MMIRIDLIGLPTSHYHLIRNSIFQLSENSITPYQILETKSIEKMVQYKVPSIPSIRIDKHINFSLGKEEPISEFLARVKTYLAKYKNQEIMKKIIVPTDFSKTSENAMEYAAHLGRLMGRKLSISHFYHPAPVSVGADVYIDSEIENIKRKSLLDFHAKMLLELESSIGILPKTETQFAFGFSTDVANRIEAAEEYAVWVIGSTGEGFSKKWLGSTSLSLVNSLNQPLFIIPPEVKFKPIRKIGFAIENLNDIPASLEWLSGFATQFEAKICLVNISEHPNKSVDKILGDIQKEYPLNDFEILTVQGQDIAQEINKVVEDKGFDLLATSRQNKGFLEKLFLRSVSEELARSTATPLLVLHH